MHRRTGSVVVALLLGWSAAAASAQGIGDALAHREQPLGPATRRYDQGHLALDLAIDLAAGRVTGTATHRLTIPKAGVTALRFHCVETSVSAVEWTGVGPCAFQVGEGLLRVTLPRPSTAGEAVTLVITYVATPTRGLWFRRPTPAHPDIPLQVWSQGEGQDNRHWIPCYDLPDDRLTSEIRVTVPAGLTVISNGAPVAPPATNADGTATHHWRQAGRHVSYLISLIVGAFDTVHDEWDGIPLDYHVPPGQGALAPAVFGRSPAIMAFFSEYTGRRYPWPRYAQTCVWDFIYGGMENTGATTLNLRALYGPAAAPDYTADGLIAHEMAHQWFGDLITCATFEHIWLNEGFATYFTDLWTEAHEGAETFHVTRRRSQQGYMEGQDLERLADLPAAAPGVPRELDGGKAYSRGALVLHQLRWELGDAVFQRAIRTWVERATDQPATSEAFRAACEAAAGRDLRWFFDQWVYGAGFPDLAVRADWEADTRTLVWRVHQRQPRRGTIGAFRFPVAIEAVAGDTVVRARPEIHREYTEWRMALPHRPDRVRFNRGGWLAARVALDIPAGWWTATLRSDDDVCGRLDAVAALGADAIAALGTAAKQDAHWAVRVAACERLGALAGDQPAAVRAALLAAAADADSRVRTAACKALGACAAAPEATALLCARLSDDPKDFVRAAAAEALSAVGGAEAVAGLRAALQTDSYRDEVRTQALKGLVRHAPAEAAALARPFTDYRWGHGAQHQLRRQALDAVVTLAPTAPETVALLAALSTDPYHRMRGWAIAHVDALRADSPAVRAALQQVVDSDPVNGNRTAAAAALQRLAGAEGRPR